MPVDQTLVSLFTRRAIADATSKAIWFWHGGQPQTRTWDELHADVRRTAALLKSLGIQPGDRVAQLSENRYEWILVDLGVALARGIHVAIHATLAAEQIVEQILDSGAKLLIVSTREQAAKLAKLSDRLPSNIELIAYEDPTELAGRAVHSFHHALSEADEHAGARLQHDAMANLTRDSLATILYTSGTTGEPKGVMLSHGNLASNALATYSAFGEDAQGTRLCWLPLSHIFARTCDLYVWLAAGGVLGLAESRDTIVRDCAQFHPRRINGVPYFFDKICRHLNDTGTANQPDGLRKLLGGALEACCSGGAPLADHVAEQFNRQGVILVQGYGLTESSPVITAGSRTANRIGTVGKPLPGIEVRIAEDGEILTRGPHVMLGYWNKPAATAEVIRDGWLHTGDLGALEDGYLRITGRKKELIVTSGGKNIAPTYLEGLLCQDPLIAQAMVLGDRQKYLAALIVPDRARLSQELAERGDCCNGDSLMDPDVHGLLHERMARRLACVSRCEQVHRFLVLERPFSIEAGELTPTLKLRRGVIAAHYAREIQQLFAD